jgi:NAD(P)-dependent dehydrogenase (short-subunit alcohol dehydrogenase family)
MTDVAVITGGASGFGRALAEGCAAHGMNVVVLDLDGDRADTEAAARAAAYGIEAFGLRVDVADGASVEVAAATVGGRFGKADLVMSNVGVQLFASIDRATDDEWRWLLDVNVIGSARVARAPPVASQGGAWATRLHVVVVGARPGESDVDVPGE